MARLRNGGGRWRATMVVAALYALLLQSFLAAATPAPPLALADGILCTHAPDDLPGPDRAPAAHHHQCCVAACQNPLLGPPPLVFVNAVWPLREPIRLAWQPAADVQARAPPGAAFHARGPPVA